MTYGPVRNPSFHHGLCLRMHRDLTGTVDHAVADDGLRVDRERRGSFVGLDCNSCRHGWVGGLAEAPIWCIDKETWGMSRVRVFISGICNRGSVPLFLLKRPGAT